MCGHTIADELREGPLTVRRAIMIGLQLCDALEKAHAEGIVHHDLGPTNIVVEDDRVVLTKPLAAGETDLFLLGCILFEMLTGAQLDDPQWVPLPAEVPREIRLLVYGLVKKQAKPASIADARKVLNYVREFPPFPIDKTAYDQSAR